MIAPLKILAASAIFLLAGFDAEARTVALPGANTVNVNVSLTMEVPLTDESLETLTATQADSRQMIYKIITAECAVLRQAIAKTCRLTNLQVNTQVRRRQGNNPLLVYVTGNAQFAIELQDDLAASD